MSDKNYKIVWESSSYVGSDYTGTHELIKVNGAIYEGESLPVTKGLIRMSYFPCTEWRGNLLDKPQTDSQQIIFNELMDADGEFWSRYKNKKLDLEGGECHLLIIDEVFAVEKGNSIFPMLYKYLHNNYFDTIIAFKVFPLQHMPSEAHKAIAVKKGDFNEDFNKLLAYYKKCGFNTIIVDRDTVVCYVSTCLKMK